MDIVLLILAILPAYFIALFVYIKDKNKEPFPLLLKLFFGGFLSAFFTILVSNLLSPIIPFISIDVKTSSILMVFLYSFIGVSLIEEACKFLVLYLAGYKDKEFDELYDIIVYSVFVGLGFATIENIIYIFDAAGVSTILSTKTSIYRALVSVPGHACFALFMGYYLSMAKVYEIRGKKKLAKKNKWLAVLVPTFLHGIYDFCCYLPYDGAMFIFFIFIGLLYGISLSKLKYVATHNRSIVTQSINKACSKCGTPVTGVFCKKCGNRTGV